MSQPTYSLKKMVAEAERLGCRITLKAGEVLILPPAGGTTLRLNRRKKDAPLVLMKLVEKLRDSTQHPR